MRARGCFFTALALVLAGTEVSWAASGDYRSAATGNWATVATWERHNGAAWIAAVAAPSNTDGAITILNGHTVTVTANVSIDQTTVDAGGQITVNSGGVDLTLANGTGVDLTISGTVSVDGTLAMVANTMTVNSGGVLTVAGTLTGGIGALTMDGTFNLSGSFTGVTTMPIGSGAVVTATNATMTMGSVTAMAVDGTLTLNGTSTLSVTRGNGGNTLVINSGGIVNCNGTSVITVTGNGNNNMQVGSGGTLAMAPGAIIDGGGDFTLASGGTLKIGSTVGITADPTASGNIQTTGGTRSFSAEAHYEYNGTSAQVFGAGFPTTITGNLTISNTAGVTLGSITANVASTVTVSGMLVCGTATIAGTGAFTLSSGGTLKIGSTAGITSAGATGNIHVSGTRTYSTGANYTYTATAAQATGDGLPATVNDLTLSSTSIVTLTSGVTVSGALSVTSGAFDQGATSSVTAGSVSISSGATYLNTGTGDLTLGGNLTNAGTLRFDGGGTTCGDADSIVIASSDATERAWSGAGKFYLQDLAVSRQGGTRALIAHNSTDNGNNGSNWNITTQSCSQSTEAKLLWVKARRMGAAGVVVEWETGRELDNLGFHLWREERGKRVQVTPDLVAGSAFLAGEGMELTAGKSYRWVDEEGGLKWNCRYWLEEVNLAGKSTWHGPAEEVDDEAGAVGAAAAVKSLPLRRVGAARQECGELNQGPAARGRVSRNLARTGGAGVDGSPAISRQWSLAGSRAVKIGVKERGWYRVSLNDLIAGGLDPRTNPGYLRLYSNGQEVPIVVSNVAGGRITGVDGIEFYGEGLDSVSTDTRMYWLESGKRPGQRIPTTSTANGNAGGEKSFRFEVEKKDQTVYFAAVQNGEGKNFFGPVISTQAVEEMIPVHHLDPDPSGDTEVSVSIQGVTAGVHRVQVALNGEVLGELEFEGRTKVEESWVVGRGKLVEGENHLAFIPQDEERDVSAVEWVRLTYWHTYTADEERLECTVSGKGEVKVGGFTGSRIRVIDVTRPEALEVLSGKVEQEEGGGYVVRVAASGARRLLVVSEKGLRSPAELKENQPSRWHAVENEGEEVILAEGRFVESVQALAELRRREGLTVSVVDVEDAYDEFGFGAKSAEALKSFLTHARSSWRKPPRYVLLVGDGSFDPRNRLGLGEWDLVPAKLVRTSVLETASDEWYVDFDGDGVGDASVGRLPVRTVEEAEGLVGKIVSCSESSCGAGERVMMVADENAGYDFEGASEESRDALPGDVGVEEIFRGRVGSDAARIGVLAGLGEGRVVVNYLGHGSVGVWGGNVLTAKDAPSLAGTQPAVFVMMTCLNGFFHDLYSESMAEALLLRSGEGGATAVWASTGLSEPEWQAELNREFLRGLFVESLTLGEAATRAKRLVPDGDARATWTLLGDPAMKVR